MNTSAERRRFEAVPREGAVGLPPKHPSARFRSGRTFRPERQVVSSSEWFTLGVQPFRGVRGVPEVGVGSRSIASPSNNSLEPTPVSKARFLSVSGGAAQLSRYAERRMKTIVSAKWLSESAGGVVEVPFAGPSRAASAASSSQSARSVQAIVDSGRLISDLTVADGGARRSLARALRQPSHRRCSSRLQGRIQRSASISGRFTPRLHRQALWLRITIRWSRRR